jgi:hypothetical protein
MCVIGVHASNLSFTTSTVVLAEQWYKDTLAEYPLCRIIMQRQKQTLTLFVEGKCPGVKPEQRIWDNESDYKLQSDGCPVDVLYSNHTDDHGSGGGGVLRGMLRENSRCQSFIVPLFPDSMISRFTFNRFTIWRGCTQASFLWEDNPVARAGWVSGLLVLNIFLMAGVSVLLCGYACSEEKWIANIVLVMSSFMVICAAILVMHRMPKTTPTPL